MSEPIKNKPRDANAIDQHVGERMRMRRVQVKMSQTTLGELLGVTFQQIQKYEKGKNRIGASRLWSISEALDVPVEWFFEGVSQATLAPEVSEDIQELSALIESRDGVKFMLALNKIEDEDVRRQLLEFVRAIGEADIPKP